MNNNEVSNEEKQQARKTYYKNYRRQNKDKMQRAQNKFWTKKALEIRKNKEAGKDD